MRRKVFDILASLGGLLIVVMLLVAGGLAMWGYSFANSSVHTQLAQQQIVFPAKGSAALASPKIGPYLNQYAGQPLTTGTQAKAYADHFIAVHLSEMPNGGVYSKVSAAAQADPTNAALESPGPDRRSKAPRCVDCCWRPTPSPSSPPSPSGPPSPRSSLRSSWRSWSDSASGTPTASQTPPNSSHRQQPTGTSDRLMLSSMFGPSHAV